MINGEVWARVASARLAYRAGERSECGALLGDAIRRAEWRQSRAHEVVALRESVVLGFAGQSDVKRLRQIADESGSGLAELHAREAEAVFARNPEALDDVAADAAEYGALLIAWEAAAVAQSVHFAAGDCAAALRSEVRHRALAHAFEGQYSVPAQALVPVLSEREMDVAAALSPGATNAEIGERFVHLPENGQTPPREDLLQVGHRRPGGSHRAHDPGTGVAVGRGIHRGTVGDGRHGGRRPSRCLPIAGRLAEGSSRICELGRVGRPLGRPRY